MGSEKTQPTLIDKDEYEKFKQFVSDAHGHTHGHLKTEIENALREYRQSSTGERQLTRIENDLATVVRLVTEQESDGGQSKPTLSEPDDTHTRADSKPEANQPREQKLDYLINEIMTEFDLTKECGELPKSDIRDIIKTNYNFRDDTVQDYYDDIVTELKAKEHPQHGQTVAWGQRYQDIVDHLREKADEEMSNL